MKVIRAFLGVALGLSLLQGCGGPEWALGESPSLAGTVKGWTQSTDLALHVRAKQDPRMSLSMGTVKADGTFRVTLPPGDVLAGHLRSPLQNDGSSCTSLPQVLPVGLRTVPVILSVEREGERLSLLTQGDRPEESRPNTSTELIYSELDGTVKGDETCGEGPGSGTTKYDQNLRKGWNVNLLKVGPNELGTIMLITDVWTAPLPANLSWRTTS